MESQKWAQELCKTTCQRKTTEIFSVCWPFKEGHLPHCEKLETSAVSAAYNAKGTSKWYSELQVFWGWYILMRSWRDLKILIVTRLHLLSYSSFQKCCHAATLHYAHIYCCEKMKIKWILMKYYLKYLFKQITRGYPNLQTVSGVSDSDSLSHLTRGEWALHWDTLQDTFPQQSNIALNMQWD